MAPSKKFILKSTVKGFWAAYGNKTAPDTFDEFIPAGRFTDELAVTFLSLHPENINQFEKYPENWHEIVFGFPDPKVIIIPPAEAPIVPKPKELKVWKPFIRRKKSTIYKLVLRRKLKIKRIKNKKIAHNTFMVKAIYSKKLFATLLKFIKPFFRFLPSKQRAVLAAGPTALYNARGTPHGMMNLIKLSF